MGRFIVVLLATLFIVGLLCCIPVLRTAGFAVAGYTVPGMVLIGGVVFYGFHRLTGK